MNSTQINRRINIILRTYGTEQPTAFAFDRERLETYWEGRFKISKLTAEWGGTLFCISQDGRVVYFSGDRRQDRCLSGDWQQWLSNKIAEVDL